MIFNHILQTTWKHIFIKDIAIIIAIIIIILLLLYYIIIINQFNYDI